MTPSIRSRMWASGIAFGLGFAVANYGILMVPRPDQIIWIVAAAVLMLTGAMGILFADSAGRLSIWAVLGLELLVAFTLVPVGWLLSLAVSPAKGNVAALIPDDPTRAHFAQVLESSLVQDAALDTVIVAAIVAAISVLVGGFAAHALARHDFRGRRFVHAIVVAWLFLPLVTIVGPLADQSLAFGLYDTRLTMVFAYLSLTLPLATWLLTRLFASVPWQLRDAARADGAKRRQVFWRMLVPVVGPGLLTVLFVVFFAGWNFLLFGLGLGATGHTQTLPAALTAFGDTFDDASATMAAATIVWLIPVLLFVLVFQRRIFAIWSNRKA